MKEQPAGELFRRRVDEEIGLSYQVIAVPEVRCFEPEVEVRSRGAFEKPRNAMA
jgi:hypothetical protein